MNQRIKKIRKDFGLTQEEFGKRLGVKRNTVATYEMGRGEPINAIISLICKEFGVNEEWLREGKGNPYKSRTKNQEIQEFANNLMEDMDESFKKKFILALSKLNESDWMTLQKLIDEMIKD